MSKLSCRRSVGEMLAACSSSWRADAGRLSNGRRARSVGERHARTLFAVTSALALGTTSASAQAINWDKVDAALGRKAAVSGDVHRYGFPRTDLTVTLDGVTIKPALALGGWLAFKPAHGGAMVMGDLVLLEAEITPVLTALIQNGLEITAIHNHVLRGNPATFYMHVGGHGDPEKMATAILQALHCSKTPLTPPASPAVPTGDRSRHRAARPDHRRQGPGKRRRLPVRRAAPRSGQGRRHGDRSGRADGRCDRDQLPADRRRQGGDHRRFRARRRRGSGASIKALRAAGIDVTAIHSHMLDEEPRLIFMHFWANDDAIKLARGLRGALDKTARAKS